MCFVISSLGSSNWCLIPFMFAYNEISLTFTAGPVCLCGVCSYVVVLGLSVRGCLGTIFDGCGDCEACAVVCVRCEYAERLR